MGMGAGLGRAAAAIAVASLTILGVGAPSAGAAQAIDSLTAQPSSTQAGGHPDLELAVGLGEDSGEAAETVEFDGPPGLVAMPPATSRCSLAQLSVATPECSPGSQVGTATISAEVGGGPEQLIGTAAVYALQTDSDEFARLGLRIPGSDTVVSAPLTLPQENEYGLEISLPNLPPAPALASLALTLWGVPADGSHDQERLPKGTAGCPGAATTDCGGVPVLSSLPLVPYLLNPTVCGVPLHWTATLTTHEDPAADTTRTASHPPTTGCDLLSFDPSYSVEPARAIGARSPLGLRIDVPQTQSPSTPSPSQLRSAEIRFDGGIELRTDELDERLRCPPQIPDDEPTVCPTGVLMGTAEIVSPIYDGPVAAMLLLDRYPADQGYRFEIVNFARGVLLQIPLRLNSDETGSPTLDFDSMPQLPLERIDLDFFGGPTSPFLTWGRCESYGYSAGSVPWDAELSEQLQASSIELDEGFGGGPCPGPAASVAVTVAPLTVAAAGTSVVEATASVADAAGRPVLEDDLRFSSSDAGQRLSPTYELEDGTYGAEIVASTAGGSVTVTATDFSVAPAISGSATINQIAALRPAKSAAPIARITAKPAKRSKKRRAIFRFSSTIAGSTFSCRLDGRRFRPCASPLTLRKLKPGRHVFDVFATSPAGAVGPPATHVFKIVKPRKRKRR
jgi:hypothetical protein